jgi:hypothetical protein
LDLGVDGLKYVIDFDLKKNAVFQLSNMELRSWLLRLMKLKNFQFGHRNTE